MIHIHELTTRSPLPLCACCSASKSTLLRKGNEIELRRSPLPPAVVAPCLKLGSLSISSDWLLVDDGDGSGDLSWRGFEKQKRNEVYYLSVNCVAGWLFFSFVFCFFFIWNLRVFGNCDVCVDIAYLDIAPIGNAALGGGR